MQVIDNFVSRNVKFKSSLPDTKLSVTYSQNIEVTDTSRSVSGISNFELRVSWHEISAYLQSVHTVHQWNRDTHPIRMRIRGFCTTRIRTPDSRYKYKRNASQLWWRGGGGVPHHFLPSFQGSQFFFGHLLKLVIFKASTRYWSQVNLTYTKGSRQKTWKIFYSKNIIPNAHACMQVVL